MRQTQKVHLLFGCAGTPFASDGKGASISRPPGYTFWLKRQRCIYSLATRVHLLLQTQKVHLFPRLAGTPFAPDAKGAPIPCPGEVHLLHSERQRTVGSDDRRAERHTGPSARSQSQRSEKTVAFRDDALSGGRVCVPPRSPGSTVIARALGRAPLPKSSAIPLASIVRTGVAITWPNVTRAGARESAPTERFRYPESIDRPGTQARVPRHKLATSSRACRYPQHLRIRPRRRSASAGDSHAALHPRP